MIRPLLLLALLLAAAAQAEEPSSLPQMVDSPALKSAFRKASAGEVELLVDVAADGSLDHARILRSAPPGIFDAAALAMIEGQRVRPTLKDGTPEPVHDRHIVLKFRAEADPPVISSAE